MRLHETPSKGVGRLEHSCIRITCILVESLSEQGQQDGKANPPWWGCLPQPRYHFQGCWSHSQCPCLQWAPAVWPSLCLGHPEWGWGWSRQVGGCRRALTLGTLGLLVCCCEEEEQRLPTRHMRQGICDNGKEENGCYLHYTDARADDVCSWKYTFWLFLGQQD